MTDADICRIADSSHEDGYRAVFEKYNGYVYTIVYNILGNTAAACDIENCVADVFADVIMHFNASENSSVQAYIGTAARNKAINVLRFLKNGSATPVTPDDMTDMLADSADVEEQTENSERAAVLLEVIESLGEPDSTIIIQKYYFDRNSRQIGKLVGLTPTNVRMRCSRAMKKLKKELSKLGITL